MPSHEKFFVNNFNINDGLHATRKRINDFWNAFVLSKQKFKMDITKIIDTFLVLTSEEVFPNDDEYGVSGLGGACGYGEK